MRILVAESEHDIARCYAVMVQLRPRLDGEGAFVAQVKRQQAQGYHLAFVDDEGQVTAVAGFRLLEMLSRGRFMYVDDLVTDADWRSHGYGDALFDWLQAYAREQGCRLLDLDSSVQRFAAHRFYFRKRMHIAAYHFALEL